MPDSSVHSSKLKPQAIRRRTGWFGRFGFLGLMGPRIIFHWTRSTNEAEAESCRRIFLISLIRMRITARTAYLENASLD
ncbi:hypothetical protein D3C72_2061120 [compost metagenome]